MNLDEKPTPTVSPPATPESHNPQSPPSTLPDEVWAWLLNDAERFAAKQIKRYRWRGARAGVLPRGYDANSIAAQAITELFEPRNATTGHNPAEQTFLSEDSEDFSLSIPIHPDVREAELAEAEEEPPAPETALPKGWETGCRELQLELHHRVRRVVNRLWHLKERLVMHNLDDLAPVVSLDGETVSLHEAVPDPDLDPHQSVVQQDDCASKQHLHEQFYAFLGNERGLKSLYACLCAGVFKRKDLARRLKVSRCVVNNRLKRLQHRAAEFSRLDSSEKTAKTANKVAFQIPHLQPLAKAA